MQSDSRQRVAYVLLWFPLASETFIFREIEILGKLGLDIRVYTMYARAAAGWSESMRSYSGFVSRMGVKSVFSILYSFSSELIRRPRFVFGLMREGLFRRMRNLESQAENTWCFLAGFLLASMCRSDGIGLIHAAWANGPATAAWVASRVSGIPFAFTGRAGDIYPPDGLLAEKIEAASFVRTNNAANMRWLSRFCSERSREKLKLVYNGLTFARESFGHAAQPQKTCHILSVGRFARTKGFTYLLTAMVRLLREKVDCRLTLVGDGVWKGKLLRMIKRLELEDFVQLPGFVPNDQLVALMRSHDMLVVPSVVHENGDRDGIPNVIMEACTQELPVIASDVCGISEVIKNGESGYLVPQRSARALSDAVRRCLKDYPHSLDMAREAHARVEKMFDSRKNAQALLDLYKNAC